MTKHNFEAETWKILELLTHSIYSNKEIFLRELISNASDAIDKARLKSLTDTNFLWDDHNFEIKIKIDKEKNIIEIEDNGIWMTEKELHSNIGTIAKSGTKDFLEKLKKAKEDWEHNLIGQFWVGFYSAFMVADKVELETKSPLDKKAHLWISDWKNAYEVSESKKENRWTIIRLFIDETNKELVSEWKIKELVKKYSNYVWVPIMLEEEKREEEKDGKEWKVIWKEFNRINETIAIWKKTKSTVKKEEYSEFYKSVSMDFNEPLTNIHSSVEWSVSYKTLLFIPKEKNMFANMDDPNKEYGPKLYVQNVLILENAKELLPVWLRFVSWVVETSDLPLNISREMLQSNAVLDKIKKSLVKKVINELKKTAENDKEWFEKFYSNFKLMLKEWVYYEWELKEELASLLRFKSLLEWKEISLDDYLDKSPEKKHEHKCKDEKWKDSCCGWECSEWKSGKTIYFITGKSENEVSSSPYLSQFRENNVDVLFFTDPIDEWLLQALSEYKWSNLKNVSSGDIKLKEETKEEKEEKEKKEKEFKDILELVKNTISSEKIEKVELNETLWDALSALRTPTNWMTPQMEKMMRAMWQPVPPQKRILELNPNSPVITAMKSEFKKDIKSEKLKDLINYSYNQAILIEWWEIENIWEFVKLTNKFASTYAK